jgi:hypothetical protein
MWTVRERGMVHTEFWFGKLRGKYHLEDLDIEGRIIVKGVFNSEDGAVTWIDLVEVRDK